MSEEDNKLLDEIAEIVELWDSRFTSPRRVAVEILEAVANYREQKKEATL